MTKYEFIKQYFIKHGIPLKSTKGVDYVLMTCEGYRVAECHPNDVTKFNKGYFPDKPKTVRVYTYLLGLYNLKICSNCKEILDCSNFTKSTAASDNLQRICKSCTKIKDKIRYKKNKKQISKRVKIWQENNKEKLNEYAAKRRAAVINRTPSWANQKRINFWYECCPKGYHVDHIIPLQGENISGLHIETNLQWLTQSQNNSKGNKWPYDTVQLEEN